MLLLESLLKTRMNIWNEKVESNDMPNAAVIKLINSSEKTVFWRLLSGKLADVLIIKHSNVLSEILKVVYVDTDDTFKTFRLASIMLLAEGSAIVIPSAMAMDDSLLDTLAFIVSTEYRCNVLVTSDIGGF